ncbi:tyrosine-type recombinase/integrase [Candidatus Pacearchaeota archaeon]|nr:tyrosine-type recombinase/integrase [Candidatus Pacearchaeota archaeon]
MARQNKIPQIFSEKLFRKTMKTYLEESKNKSLYSRFSRMRNVVIFYICYYQGFRPKEAFCIEVSHLIFEQKEIYIPAQNNKQRNQDMFPMSDFIISLIKEFMIVREEFLSGKTSKWLFPSTRNPESPVYRGTLIRGFTRAIESQELKQVSYVDAQGKRRLNLSIYSLRHSFGTNAMMKMKDIKQVAKVLRHYDVKCRSTYIYVHTDAQSSRRELLNNVVGKKNLNTKEILGLV